MIATVCLTRKRICVLCVLYMCICTRVYTGVYVAGSLRRHYLAVTYVVVSCKNCGNCRDYKDYWLRAGDRV